MVTGPLPGVAHLESFWSRVVAQRTGGGRPPTPLEWSLDGALLGALGLNLKEALDVLLQRGLSLRDFEQWVIERRGGSIDPLQLARFNAAVAGTLDAAVDPGAPRVLEPDDLAHFEEHGYLVVHDAATPSEREAAVAALWKFLRMDPEDDRTWYAGPQGHGIWVPFIHHPALDAIRASSRIRRVFEELWGRSDLWPTVDQTGFNPPERPDWPFPGPHLHWDVSLTLPIPFGLQGLVYLTDTVAEQGAFTCVPGFQRRIEGWLASLPPGEDPRQQDLRLLGPVPIAGRAGDLVIWHQALPHGSSPNRTRKPRLVQYLTMRPTYWLATEPWR